MQSNGTANEPLPENLGKVGDRLSFQRCFQATRPKFFPASLLPVVVGTAWGFAVSGHLDVSVAILAALATLLVHAAANVLNDVGDDIGGTDQLNTDRIFPYTGGSRFIQNGIMSRSEMTRLSVILFAFAAAIGVVLIWLKGLTVLWFGLAGVLIAVAYSIPGMQLSGRGLGELAVGAGFGVVPVVGAAWLQSGQIESGGLLVSLPTGAWISAILLINEVPDMKADAASGKRTLPVRIGRGPTRFVFAGLHAVALGALALMIGKGLVTFWVLAVPLGLTPLVVFAAAGITAQTGRLTKSIEATLAIQAIGSVWLALAVVLFA